MKAREELGQELNDCLEAIPEKEVGADWMFGHGELPNAFIFVRDGSLCILPKSGGLLECDLRELGADIAPFAD